LAEARQWRQTRAQARVISQTTRKGWSLKSKSLPVNIGIIISQLGPGVAMTQIKITPAGPGLQ